MTRKRSLAAVLFALLAATSATLGCAPRLTHARLLDASALARLPSGDDDERFGKAPAAALLWHERFAIETPTGEPIQTLIQLHAVVLIRNKKGIDEQATVRIRMDEDSVLEHFEARSISPSGQVTEVEPDHVFDDKASFGERGTSHRSFRFPRVEVGSLLEYTYTIRMKGYYTAIERQPPLDMPTVDYQMELLASRYVSFEARLHNTQATFQRDKVGSHTRLRLALREVPADETSDFTPHWSLRRPWWEVRLKRFAWRHSEFNVTQTWKDTYRFAAERLYTRDDDLFEGFDLDIEDSDCGDAVRCKAERALAVLRERAEMGALDGSFWSLRSAKKVLADGRADNFEKAMLLFGVLDDAGVDARFAVLSPRFSRAVEKRAPNMSPMSHVVIYLPAQRGLEQELWLDPSCEWCSPGELPSWSRGIDSLVIGFEEKAFQRKEGLAEWRVVTGGPAPATRQRYRYHATLQEDGDLEVDLVVEEHGAHAWRLRRDTRADAKEDALQRAESLARGALATAQLQSFDRPECDRAAGRCVHRYRYLLPGFATRDGAEWLLPLGVMRHAYDHRLSKKERDHDILAREDDEVSAELVVKLPKTMELERVLKPQRSESELAAFSFDMQPAAEGFKVTRSLVVRSGLYPKARYDDLRRPLDASREARQNLVSLVPAAEPKGE